MFFLSSIRSSWVLKGADFQVWRIWRILASEFLVCEIRLEQDLILMVGLILA
jgi:hypothetical protein